MLIADHGGHVLARHVLVGRCATAAVSGRVASTKGTSDDFWMTLSKIVTGEAHGGVRQGRFVILQACLTQVGDWANWTLQQCPVGGNVVPPRGTSH